MDKSGDVQEAEEEFSTAWHSSDNSLWKQQCDIYNMLAEEVTETSDMVTVWLLWSWTYFLGQH